MGPKSSWSGASQIKRPLHYCHSVFSLIEVDRQDLPCSAVLYRVEAGQFEQQANELDVRLAQATRPEDVDMLLNKMADKDMLETKPHQGPRVTRPPQNGLKIRNLPSFSRLPIDLLCILGGSPGFRGAQSYPQSSNKTVPL
eukprot:3057640-Amphidinium_carterae.1